MNYMMIPEALCSIKDDTFQLLKYLRAAEMTDIAAYPDVYTEFISEAEGRAEHIACAVRRLVYRTTEKKKSELLSEVARCCHDITIKQEHGWLSIRLPRLIPKKKNANAEFLSEPLLCALSEYVMEHGVQRFSKAVICFEHIYDRKLPLKNYRDYDNLEQKQILDVIALHLLADDNSGLCDIFNTSEAGDDSYTNIYVMAQKLFFEWLKVRKNISKNETPQTVSETT